MNLVLFLAAIAASLVALLRYRTAPKIYWITGALFIVTLIWNEYAANSCEGGCNIRVDLLLVIPVLVVATGLSFYAFFKSKSP